MTQPSSLFARLFPRAEKKSFSRDLPFGYQYQTFMSHPGKPVWSGRNYAKFSDEGYIKNVIAHRCANMIATAAASVGWQLFEVSEQGRRVIHLHPVLDLLNHPNPLQGGSEFFEGVYAYRLISGNAYIESIGATDGPPRELYTLRPDRVNVIAGKDGLPMGYRYTVRDASGQERYTNFPVDRITGQSPLLHVKTFHPLDDWYGLSPVEAAAYSIDQHNQASAWNQALLQNGARPSGALVVKPGENGVPGTLSEEQYYRLKEQIDTQFSGAANAGRPILLEGGLDWKEMSLSPKDMDFLNAKYSAAREVALAFGVPPQLLGIPGDNTYSNLAEARLALWEQTILPLIDHMSDALNLWLMPKFGEGLKLTYTTDNIAALSPRREQYWNQINTATFLSAEEKKVLLGFGGGVEKKYRADQPRVPAGHEDGGQWTSGGGGGSGLTQAPQSNKPSPGTIEEFPQGGGGSSGAEIDWEEGIGVLIGAVATILSRIPGPIGRIFSVLRLALPRVLRGAEETGATLPKPKGIPDDWVVVPSNKGEGTKYADPRNPGTYVRVSPGDPKSSYPNSRQPYVRWQVNGRSLDSNGNPVSKYTNDAHIPVKDYKFDPKVLK